MDKILVVYSMKGCPWCVKFKEMLNELNITFYDRDIEKHTKEYQEFVKITQSEFIPAFLLIEDIKPEPLNYFYVPDKHFETLEDAIKIIQEHFSK